MNLGIRQYCDTLIQGFGRGWNRFWFAPIDPFALCVLRCCVGVLGAWWYWDMGRDFEFLFGEGGLLNWDKVQEFRGVWIPSIFDWARTNSDLMLIRGVGTAAFVAFAVGCFSRVMNILCLAFTLSVLQRAIMFATTHTPVPEVLAFVLLYLCLAPTGAALSVDSFWRSKKGKAANDSRADARSYGATLATRLLQLHIVLVYIGMVVAKLRLASWWKGDAMWWLAANPQNRLIDLSQTNEYVLNLWTHAVVLFELAFAILIWNSIARPLLLALSVVAWGALCLVTGDVQFSLLMIALGLAYVSPNWLRSVGPNSSADAKSGAK